MSDSVHAPDVILGVVGIRASGLIESITPTRRICPGLSSSRTHPRTRARSGSLAKLDIETADLQAKQCGKQFCIVDLGGPKGFVTTHKTAFCTTSRTKPDATFASASPRTLLACKSGIAGSKRRRRSRPVSPGGEQASLPPSGTPQRAFYNKMGYPRAWGVGGCVHRRRE